MPFFLFLLFFSVFCGNFAQANENLCLPGSLAIEFQEPSLTLRLSGDLVTGNNAPYTYTIAEEGMYEGELRLSLNLTPKSSPDHIPAMPRHTVRVESKIQLTKSPKSLFIDVTKDYLGSPEYFRAQLESGKTVCMTPEMYKL